MKASSFCFLVVACLFPIKIMTNSPRASELLFALQRGDTQCVVQLLYDAHEEIGVFYCERMNELRDQYNLPNATSFDLIDCLINEQGGTCTPHTRWYVFCRLIADIIDESEKERLLRKQDEGADRNRKIFFFCISLSLALFWLTKAFGSSEKPEKRRASLSANTESVICAKEKRECIQRFTPPDIERMDTYEKCSPTSSKESSMIPQIRDVAKWVTKHKGVIGVCTEGLLWLARKKGEQSQEKKEGDSQKSRKKRLRQFERVFREGDFTVYPEG